MSQEVSEHFIIFFKNLSELTRSVLEHAGRLKELRSLDKKLFWLQSVLQGPLFVVSSLYLSAVCYIESTFKRYNRNSAMHKHMITVVLLGHLKRHPEAFVTIVLLQHKLHEFIFSQSELVLSNATPGFLNLRSSKWKSTWMENELHKKWSFCNVDGSTLTFWLDPGRISTWTNTVLRTRMKKSTNRKKCWTTAAPQRTVCVWVCVYVCVCLCMCGSCRLQSRNQSF